MAALVVGAASAYRFMRSGSLVMLLAIRRALSIVRTWGMSASYLHTYSHGSRTTGVSEPEPVRVRPRWLAITCPA